MHFTQSSMFKQMALVLDLKSRTQSLIWYRSTLVSFIDLVNKCVNVSEDNCVHVFPTRSCLVVPAILEFTKNTTLIHFSNISFIYVKTISEVFVCNFQCFVKYHYLIFDRHQHLKINRGLSKEHSYNIIYSYKYIESDLIKHCHVIFIHLSGRPLIVRSTAREEIPRKFPREPHMFPIIVTSIDSTDNKHGVQRQVRCCRRRRNFIYYIEYFRKAAGILLLGV